MGAAPLSICWHDGELVVVATGGAFEQALREQYAYIESLLGDGRDWAVPGGYTVVDPYLLVFYEWGVRIDLDMKTSYPAWRDLTQRTLQRPAVQRALANEKISVS
jgi:glutathione S-transferase